MGSYLLMLCVLSFGLSSLFSYAYFGTKCWAFLAGAERKHWYNYFYTGSIIISAVVSLTTILSFIDLMFAIMAIPTVFSAIWLSPNVSKATKEYFKKLSMR